MACAACRVWLSSGRRPAACRQVTDLGSALLNPETEPLVCQMPKIKISAVNIISDEEFSQSYLKILESEDLVQTQ